MEIVKWTVLSDEDDEMVVGDQFGDILIVRKDYPIKVNFRKVELLNKRNLSLFNNSLEFPETRTLELLEYGWFTKKGENVKICCGYDKESRQWFVKE